MADETGSRCHADGERAAPPGRHNSASDTLTIVLDLEIPQPSHPELAAASAA
jgi:hypothetical protein